MYNPSITENASYESSKTTPSTETTSQFENTDNIWSSTHAAQHTTSEGVPATTNSDQNIDVVDNTVPSSNTNTIEKDASILSKVMSKTSIYIKVSIGAALGIIVVISIWCCCKKSKKSSFLTHRNL